MVPDPCGPRGDLRDHVGREGLVSEDRFDIQHALKFPLLPSKVLVLLTAACLVWIGLLSLAFVFVMGTGASAGWIVAGLLFCALLVWAVVMRGEYRNAIDLTEDFEPDACLDCRLHSAADSSPVPPRFKTEDAWPASSLEGRGILMTGRRDKPQSGKSRRRRPIQPHIR